MKLSRILTEALDLQLAIRYTSKKRNPAIQQRLDAAFDIIASQPNAKTSKRADRIYIPFRRDVSTSETYRNIKAALEEKGYKLVDYLKGIAKDRYGRELKLGKALTKLNLIGLRNKYNIDPVRASKEVEGYLVFSKHPYDIAGMAAGRKWTEKSCMDIYTKSTADQFVTADIENGTFIVYYVGPEDLNIEDPEGRVLVKPFISVDDPDEVFYSTDASRVYGNPPKGFFENVLSVLDKIKNFELGKFRLINSLYCDKYTTRDIIRIPKVLTTKQQVKKVLKYISTEKIEDLDYYINDDLSVSMYSDLHIQFPDQYTTIPVNFKEAFGDFSVTANGLTSLKNAPQKVYGDFTVTAKSKKNFSLEGGPEYVKKSYIIYADSMKNLEGAPKFVGQYFNCENCGLESLEGTLEHIGTILFCGENDLSSLKGAPSNVLYIHAPDNYVSDLLGAPVDLSNKRLNLSKNHLKTLKGTLKRVGELNVSKQMSGKSFTEDDAIRAGITVDTFKG